MKIAAREFSAADQRSFAELSGDFNPVHVDSLQARRLIFGSCVVHGMHLLLWALDQLSAELSQHVEILTLDVSFIRPAHPNEPVHLTQSGATTSSVTLEVRDARSTLLRADLAWRAAPQESSRLADSAPIGESPADLSLDEIRRRRGSLALYLDRAKLLTLFPRLGQFAAEQLAVLLGVTRLVGMECPGMHSILAGLTLSRAAGSGAELAYRVAAVNERFSSVSISIDAPSLKGTVQSFLRPAPQEQSDLATLSRIVRPHEFAGQRALVIGGSRGLGEVSAKLLALGDADVVLTYRHGEQDAQRVVAEIRAWGRAASSVRFDVAHIGAELPAQLTNPAPSHLYYFATPFIFSGSATRFSPELFEFFCRHYVTGFGTLVEALEDPLRVLLPSSVAVDERPADMKEYVAAKSAAEALALCLCSHRNLRVHAPRLPRLRTDQTARLLPTSNQEAAPIVLEHLRYLASLDQDRVTLPSTLNAHPALIR